MAGSVAAEPSHRGMVKSGTCTNSHDKIEELDNPGSRWYFSRKEIEENSPSRRDGIDLKKESYLRKSYCTFLQDLGMKLKVPQVTIATAIVFCHRFFRHQSHSNNDWRTIATVCMFLAGKVEETPRPLKDVILVSYEIIHKKDPSAVQRIKLKEVYEQQKELILLGERVVLTTLGFDFNVHHPYKPLVEAIKKFKVAQNALAQVAWNFVNDGLRTSLCLQFKPHHIAAGAIFLAAKFLKVKLPSDIDKVWWQEFDVTPRQLEDVSNQMLELYEQNRAIQSSHPNEAEDSTGGGTNHPAKTTLTVSENSMSVTGPSLDVGAANVKHGAQVVPPSRLVPDQLKPQSTENNSNDNGSAETKSGVWDHNMDGEGKDSSHQDVEQISCSREYKAYDLSCSKLSLEQPIQDGWKDKASLSKTACTSGRDSRYGDAMTKIDKDKVKAALEKRRKLRNDVAKKTDIMDEDDLIERELENGIEMAAVDEKMKCEKRNGWLAPLNRQQLENQGDSNGKRNVRVSDQQASHGRIDTKSFDHGFEDNGEEEEAELSSLEEHELPSPKLQKDKGAGWPDYLERDQKRLRCETHG